MICLKNVESLAAFKRNTAEYVKKIKASGVPLVLTIKGKTEIVVQDIESYQRMLEALDRIENIKVVREGLESVRHGKTMSLEKFGSEMGRGSAPRKAKTTYSVEYPKSIQ